MNEDGVGPQVLEGAGNPPTRRRFLRATGIAITAGGAVASVTGSVLGAATGSGRWRSFQCDAGNTGYTTETEGPVTDVELAWSVDVGAPVYGQPVMSGGTIVVGAIGTKQDTGRLVGIGTEGSRRWSQTGPLSILTSAAIRDETVYRTSSGSLTARSLADGSERWSVSVPASPFASPTIADGTVLVGARDGSLRALAGDTGDERWRVDFSAGVSATPAYREGTVYAAAENGAVRALGLGDGNRRWSTDVGEPVRSGVTVGSDAVVVASTDATLTALDAETGAERWTHSVDQPTATSPVLADGTLYWAAGNAVMAVDLESGHVQWRAETDGYSGLNHVGPAPVGSKGTIYVTTGRSTVYAFARSDGTERWSFSPSEGTDLVSVGVDAGRVYVGTTDGRLLALEGRRNFRPTAAFTYTPRDPSPGETVTFDAGESSDPDGSIATYRWDFDGDDSFEATSERVSRSFQEGTYDVTLEVVDGEGATARTTADTTLSVRPVGTTDASGSDQGDGSDLAALVDRIPGEEVGVGAAGGVGVLGVLLAVARKRRSTSETKPTPGQVSTSNTGGSSDEAPASTDASSASQRDPGTSSRGASRVRSRTHPVETMDVRFDDLEFGDELGTGARTRVQEAIVGGVSPPVAVETLGGTGGETFDTDRIERFVDGVDTWSKIDDHPNVASVVASGSEPFPWAAMERCGGSLDPTAVDGLSFEEIRELFVGVLEGVHHGHRYGLEHGALTPGNVLYLDSKASGVEDGVPVVSDWELAAPHLDPALDVGSRYPRFAAPEQVSLERFGEPGVLADVYQLGVFGYALFTGRYPVDDATTAFRGSEGPTVPAPSGVASDVPAGLDEVLATALLVESSDRYETVLHFRDALQAV
jgi:outer membrane protein assembly factor BamB